MEHYFSAKPTSSSNIKEISYKGFRFLTDSSIFSREHVDPGSDILIKNCLIENGQKVLDLGCGYGPVSIAVGKKYPECEIIASDINERALELTKKNLILNKVENVRVVKSHLYDNIPEKFDSILSNPPQSAGKKLCMQIIEQAPMHLAQNGSLQIVARHNKGGKEFMKKMNDVFGNADTLARQSGYHVYISIKKDPIIN